MIDREDARLLGAISLFLLLVAMVLIALAASLALAVRVFEAIAG
jgi:hypothetical protein